MSPVIVYHKNAKGREDCWMVDEVVELTGQEIALYRSEQHMITLTPEDYENGLCIIDLQNEGGEGAEDIEPVEHMQRMH